MSEKEKKKLTKKQKIIIVVSCICIVAVVAASATVGVLFYQPRYDVDLTNVVRADNLIWSDEFEGDSLDESIWHIENELDCGGAYHRSSSIRVEDGFLNIDIFYNEETGEWQCGGVDTMPRYDDNGNRVAGKTILYGYFEIRAKLADLGGCWSTFWLLSENFTEATTSRDAATYGAEIDIVESPRHPDNVIQQAVHNGGWGNHHTSVANPRYLMQKQDKDLYNEFATYGLYWNEDIYKFYIDGECVWTTHMNHNVSQQPEGIWLTIGTIAGYNDNLKTWAGGNHLYNNDHSARSSYVIDYIRVYGVYDDDGSQIR